MDLKYAKNYWLLMYASNYWEILLGEIDWSTMSISMTYIIKLHIISQHAYQHGVVFSLVSTRPRREPKRVYVAV